MTRLTTAALLILLALVPVIQAQSPAPTPTAAALDAAVSATVRAWNVPGVAVAVVRDGRVVLSRGFGVQRAGESATVDDATAFYTASITKTFTVTALGMLADAGKLRIDDPVGKYLPEFGVADPDTTRLATVRDLMAHRTGLPRADLLMFSGLSNDEVLTRLKRVPSAAPLRTRFTYQNQMYLALGELTARLSGSSWQSTVESGILSRLGMTDSNAAGLGRPAGRNAAVPHAIVNGVVSPVEFVPRAPYGAGGLNASARDLAKWLQFQLGDGTWQGTKLVNPQVLTAPQQPNAITAPTIWTPDATFLLYGLGWFISDYHGHKVVQHGGNGEGWTSLLWMMPNEKLGIAVLTNMHNTLLPWAIAHTVADAYGGGGRGAWDAYFLEAERSRSAAQARQAPKAGTGELDASSWVGTWDSPVYGPLTITSADGRVSLRYGPSLSGDLAPGATASDAVLTWQRSDVLAVLGPSALKRSTRGTDSVLSINLAGDVAEFVKVK
jgi:CubicO group peptidase (beta-lactamase class C family)